MIDFKNEYSKPEFIGFLKDFLPDFQVSEENIDVNKKFRYLKSLNKIGQSKTIDVKVFEIDHESENDPRVSLSKESFILMKELSVSKALIVFKNSKSKNYRFSLITFESRWDEGTKIKTEFSNPRRYSFFLGKDARINTPVQFLTKKGMVVDLLDLKSRFSVEVVSDNFYKQYRELFIKLARYLQKDNAFQAFAIQNGVDTINFAKKMLGQVVFLYFIQRKGWLGAKQGDLISNGDKNFLRNLFNKSHLDKVDFFNHYLEPLFYNALNAKTEKAGSFYRNYFDCQIPFLNGGLFEPLENYKWDSEYLNIPNNLFSTNPEKPEDGKGILDVFDSYNFTIYENDLIDKEVSIDPEMLGQIFEKLGAITTETFDDWAKAIESHNKTREMKANKKLGVYYTPREIVHYMCRESIVNYLVSNHTNISESNVKKYLDYSDALSIDLNELKKIWQGESFSPGQFKEIDELLKGIKVVDPACGSGAFLIGMLQEIVRLRAFVQISADQNIIPQKSYYDLKKETIQNCIYGVDIDLGATEIAKLRLWLSLVVDHELEEIEPLPNLDYKIMQGNSLLENLVIGDSIIEFKFNGSKKIDGRTKEMKNLFEEEMQEKLFYDASETLAEKIEKYHSEFFSTTNSEGKKILKKKIDSIENELINIKCEEELKKLENIVKNNILDSSKITKLTYQILSIKEKLKKWQKDKLRPFFPWRLHFGEVFGEKNGFDVVIANPPYGAEMEKNELRVLKRNLVDTKNTNSASIFIDFSRHKLLNSTGTLSFIVPKSLLYSELWFDQVKSLVGKTKILVDVEKAFDSVLLEQVLFIYGNSIVVDRYNALKFLNNNFQQSTVISNESVDIFKAWICDVTQDELIIANRIIESTNIEYMSAISKTKRGLPLQKDLKDEGNYPVLGGKNIFRYGYSGVKGYLSADNLLEDEKVKFLLQPKIISQRLVAHIQNPKPHVKIMSAYDPKGKILSVDTVENTIITNDKFDVRFILSLINSQLIGWFTYKFIFCAAVRTIDFDNGYVGKIPVPNIGLDDQEPFIDLVEQIAILTSSKEYLNDVDKRKKVQMLENQIDQMVYKLYGLSQDEVKVIEYIK